MTVASCVVLSGSFAISTFYCFLSVVGMCWHKDAYLCVCVSFYHLYFIYNPFYVSIIFLNCHDKILLFYVLTCVALLNIVIYTSAL